MKNAKLIMWSVMAVVLVSILSFMLINRPPRYEGRKIAEWIRDLEWVKRTERDTRASKVIDELGEVAIPELLSALVKTDPWWVSKGNELLARQSITSFRFTTVMRPYTLSSSAARGFEVLTNRATSAVPELIRILTNAPNDDVRWCAAVSLGSIGPGASNAVTHLVATAAHTNRVITSYSLWALNRIGGDPQSVVPILTNRLYHHWYLVSVHAAQGLGSLGTNATSAIPHLVYVATNKFPNQDSSIENASLNALRKIDPQMAAEVQRGYREMNLRLRSSQPLNE